MSHTVTSLPVSASRSVPDMTSAYRSGFPALSTTTRVPDYDADSRSRIVTQETAKDWLKGMIVSRPDHASARLCLLTSRLKAYRDMPEEDRWPAADWPADRAFRDAHTFIGCLPLSSIPVPEISLADDGEINFLWENENVYIDLGFYGTGTYSYFARDKTRDKNKQDILGEDIPALEGLPDRLKELLSA